MHLIVLGRRWKLDETTSANLPDRWGDCDPPARRHKKIRIRRSLKGTHRAEILIHEMLHAAGWPLDEEFVSQFARDAARNLERTGCLKN